MLLLLANESIFEKISFVSSFMKTKMLFTTLNRTLENKNLKSSQVYLRHAIREGAKKYMQNIVYSKAKELQRIP